MKKLHLCSIEFFQSLEQALFRGINCNAETPKEVVEFQEYLKATLDA